MTTYCDLMDLPQDQCSHCTVERPRTEQVQVMAQALLREHGLSAQGWVFQWDSAKTRMGLCRHSKRIISLSKHWAAELSVESSRQTILHEIAHALVGPGHKHNMVWERKAREVGVAKPGPCGDTEGVRLERAAVGVCPAGHRTEAHRLPQRVKSCSKCSHRFDPSALFTWYLHGTKATMGPRYRSELTAIENKMGAQAALRQAIAAMPTKLQVQA